MKKLSLLLSAVLCCFSGFSLSLSPSSTNISSSGLVTFTGVGETASNYYTNETGHVIVSVASPNQAYLSNITLIFKSGDYYTPPATSPTKLVYEFINPTPVAVTLNFKISVQPDDGTHPLAPVDYTYSITVQPANPGHFTYYNAPLSRPFTRSNCAAGTVGTTVNYTVPGSMFSSIVSQMDADNQASAYANTNGPGYANSFGQCVLPTVYVHLSSDIVSTTHSGTVTTQVSDIKLSFYSDAAETHPFVLTSPLSVLVRLSTIIVHGSGSNADTTYPVPAGVSSYDIGNEVTKTTDTSIGFYGTTLYQYALQNNGTYLVD